MSQPLKDYLEPELGPARLARNRAAIERRLAERPWPARLFVIGGAALVAAGALLVLWPTPGEVPARPVWSVTPDARMAATEAEARVDLEDGTTIDLEAHSSLRGLRRAPEELAIELVHGGATFDVAHVEGRAFRVATGDVTVRVLGTRFRVGRDAGQVSVRVERGRVEVTRGTERVVLGPGESWSGAERLEPPSEPVEATVAPVAPTDVEVAEAPVHERRSSAPAPTEDARALFEAAREARRDGRPDRAAALYAELLEQHPSDARAGLAAFELGRIRADLLADPRGAVDALETALRTPGASYRSDALARLVVLYDRLGDTARCRDARSRYLEDFAEGPHAAEVLSHCE